MSHITGTLTGHETIFTRGWIPASPRAIVLLVHGLGEHSGRYEHVAAYLNKHGYAVYSLDHKGHGKSGGMPAMITSLHDYVSDLTCYFEQIRAEYPSLPMFVYGHSMGSLIGLLFTLDHQDQLVGVVTTGTALKLPGANRVLIPIFKGLSRLIPRVPVTSLAAEGISRDPDVVQRYKDDPLVYHSHLRLGLIAALQNGADEVIRRLPDLYLPYLALHGSHDPIALPAAVDIIRQQSGSSDTTIKVYEGLYHEIHNEKEQGDVLGDIVAWLDQHLPA
jgi:lysophospholipase